MFEKYPQNEDLKFNGIEQYLIEYYSSIFDDMHTKFSSEKDVNKLEGRIKNIQYYSESYSDSLNKVNEYIKLIKKKNNFNDKSHLTKENELSSIVDSNEKIENLGDDIKMDKEKSNKDKNSKFYGAFTYLKNFFGHTEDYLFFNLFISINQNTLEFILDFSRILKILDEVENSKKFKNLDELEIVLKIVSYRKGCIKCRNILFLIKICLNHVLKHSKYANLKKNIVLEYLHYDINKKTEKSLSTSKISNVNLKTIKESEDLKVDKIDNTGKVFQYINPNSHYHQKNKRNINVQGKNGIFDIGKFYFNCNEFIMN